jgi:hypothetical protein
MSNQVDGALLHAMSGTELSRVNTDVLPCGPKDAVNRASNFASSSPKMILTTVRAEL